MEKMFEILAILPQIEASVRDRIPPLSDSTREYLGLNIRQWIFKWSVSLLSFQRISDGRILYQKLAFCPGNPPKYIPPTRKCDLVNSTRVDLYCTFYISNNIFYMKLLLVFCQSSTSSKLPFIILSFMDDIPSKYIKL